MVLRIWPAVAGCLAALSCLPRPAVVRAPERMGVAVALVRDLEDARPVADLPAGVPAALGRELARRNLGLARIPFETSAPGFEAVKDSRARLARLASWAGDAPLMLLVEVRARFFSQINGRYRWTVHVRLTAAAHDGEPVSAELEQPVFVDFEHQREDAAVAAAAEAIAERVGALFDGFLGGAVPGARASRPEVRQRAEAIYFVMIDRFANGDAANDGAVDPNDPAAFHGGDLKGIVAHLDELKALGVGAVWLSPVFKTRTEKFFGHGAFHGYWVEDLARVEPRFGTEEELKLLSDELHRRGMRLYLDMVLNHVANDAPLTREHPDWFHGRGPLTNWDDPAQLVDADVHGLPDLAQEREQVSRYLVDTSLGWVDRIRPDGFRLDAVKHVPLAFWARYNAQVRSHAGRGFLILGEMLDGDPAVLARVEREGGFGAMFDFPLYYATIDVFCRSRPAARLGAALSSDRLYDDSDSLVTLLDNHDLPRILTDCGGSLERVRRALTFQLTARGTPALTWGTEAGLTGSKEPLNRGDMRFDAGHPLRAHIERLLALRRGHPALYDGALLVLASDETLFAYARVHPDEAAFVVVNQRLEAARVPLPAELAGLHAGESVGDLSIEGGVLVAPPSSTTAAVARAPRAGALAALARRQRAQWRTGAEKRVVEVEAAGAPAGESDEVRLVGSGPELGAWDPARGLGAILAGGTSRFDLPVGAVVEFKLVVRHPGGQVVWEPGENRALFVQAGVGPVRLKLRWSVAG